MKKATNIIGYVVLDELKAVRHTPTGYVNWNSRYPIALFRKRKVAARVRRLLRREYLEYAARFDPAKDADNERCFHLWKKRGESVCIRPVQSHNPSVQEVRAFVRREGV